jgi:hypothetical protein
MEASKCERRAVVRVFLNRANVASHADWTVLKARFEKVEGSSEKIDHSIERV